MEAVRRSPALPGVKKRKLKPERLTLTLMALPFVAFILVFSYVPIFGWIYAFFDFKPGISLFQAHFVGLKYFKLIFTFDGDMPRVMTNTLVMSFLGLATSILPVIFAVMISEVPSRFFKKLVQTTTTLPNFISWVIIFSLAFNIFSSEGLLNNLLMSLHLISKPLNILGNDDIVWFFQITLNMWKNLGWGAIIYLAAIAGIDNELYDAVSVDGAGRFRKIWHVTIPGVAPTYIVLLLLGVSNILSAGFEQYFVFYNGLVADKIEVLDYYIYRIGLVSNQYSYGTAIGIAKTVISLILLFTVNRLSKAVRGSAII